eukprot:m.1582997 g.1582997  ORF g.1582997 m.1582997 type:complete len:1743 (+) comp25319_c0_seq4:162-5390(+)
MGDPPSLPVSASLYHVTYGNGLIRYVGSANVDGLGVDSLNQAIDDLTDFTTDIFISPELYQNVVFVATDSNIVVTDYLTDKELFRTRLKDVSVCSWGGKEKSQYMGYMAQQKFGSMAVGHMCHVFQCDCSDTAKEVVKTIGQAFLTGGGCNPSDLLMPSQEPQQRSGRRPKSRPSSATFDVDEGLEPTASDTVSDTVSSPAQRTTRRFLRGQRVLSRRRRSVEQVETGRSYWDSSEEKYSNPPRSYTSEDDDCGSSKNTKKKLTSFLRFADHRVSETPDSRKVLEAGSNTSGDTMTGSNDQELSEEDLTVVGGGDTAVVRCTESPRGASTVSHQPPGVDDTDTTATAEYFVQQTAQNLLRRLLADADHNIIHRRRNATGVGTQACFSGADVVAWLIRSGDFSSRKHATAFMRTLYKAHAIVAVASPSPPDFEDSPGAQFSFGTSAMQPVAEESGKGSSADDLTEYEACDLADSFDLIKAIAQDAPDKVGDILDAMVAAAAHSDQVWPASSTDGAQPTSETTATTPRASVGAPSASFVASCAHHAVKMKATKVAQMLLETWQCDVNSRARGGETLLHRAANFGDTSMVQLLLDHDASVHATATKDGGTPLFRASRLRNIGCAILLIEHGARLTVTNADGVRPVDLLPDLHETQQRLCCSVGESLAAGTGGVDKMHMLRRLVSNDENDTVLIKHLQRSDTAAHVLSLCQDHGSVSQWWHEVVALLFTKGFRRRRSADLGLMDTVLQFVAYPGHLQEQALRLANELVDEDFECDGGLGSLSGSAAPSRQTSASKLPEMQATPPDATTPPKRATAAAAVIKLETLHAAAGVEGEERRWSASSAGGGERRRTGSSSRRQAPSAPSCYRQQMAGTNLLPLVRALAYDDANEALRAARVLGVVSVFPKAQRSLASAATVGYLCTMCAEIETWDEHRELGGPIQEYLMQTLANVVKQADKHAVWHEVGALARIAAVLQHRSHSVVLQTYAARIFVYLGSKHLSGDINVLKIAKSESCGPKNDHVEGVYQKKILQIDEDAEYMQTSTPTTTSAVGKRWPLLKGASLEYFLHVVLDDMSRFDQRLFFLIYRFYCAPTVLFRALTFPLRNLEPTTASPLRAEGSQECGEVAEGHRRIFAALKIWIETRIADFVDNSSLLAELRSLLGALQSRSDAYGDQAQRLLDTGVSDATTSRAAAPSGVADFSKAAHQLMYAEASQRIRSGKLPCPKELAVTLAATELYIEDMMQALAPSQGARAAATPPLSLNIKGAVRQALPPRMRKDKDAVQLVAAEYERICGITERDAKHLYLHTCQLVAFDYFSVKLVSSNPQSKRRGVAMLLGISNDKAVLLNDKTKSIETEITLSTLRKCTLGGTDLFLGKSSTYLVMHVDETGSGESTKLYLAGEKDTIKRAYQMIILALQMMASAAGGDSDVADEVASLNPQTASKTLASMRVQSQKYVCVCPPSPLVGELDLRTLTQVQMLSAPVEVARQLTVIEHNMLKQISLEDLIDRIFNNANPPSCESFIAHFNLLTRWVATLILDQPERETRAVLIQQFIRVGMELLALGNFNGVMEIVSALSSVSLRRLRATWQLVDPGLMEDLCALEQIMDFTNNFQNYRVALEKSRPPSVPYFGVVLKDLTSLHHGNPHRLSLGHINVGKWRSVFALLQSFYQHQCSVYKFIVVPEFQSRLRNLRAYDEATIDKKSKELLENPRGTHTPRFTLGGTISSFIPQRRQSSSSGAPGSSTSGTKF